MGFDVGNRRLATSCASLLLGTLWLASAMGAEPCPDPRARLVSLVGGVELRRSGASGWSAATLDEAVCTGDTLRTQAESRAGLRLPDATVLRLDQNSALTFQPSRDTRRTWLDVLAGAVHVISRDPRAIRVLTPFANAGIEGTEFLVSVGDQAASFLVLEGAVRVESAAGSAEVASGERVTVTGVGVPVVSRDLQPRDAVVWTLYFPPVTAADAAFDASRSTARAIRLLAAGQVTAARTELTRIVATERNAEALALESIVALTLDDRPAARQLADAAVALDPTGSAPLLARAYGQQADANLAAAIDTLESARVANPGDALVLARLAELRLGSGDYQAASQLADQATRLDPRSSGARVVRGFASLAAGRPLEAELDFSAALAADSSAPFPRLGRALAAIRRGDLAGGREELETAVILDPGNALVRSYMGKAYHDEKRDDKAASQLAIAKELDPADPTPWYYDGIRKQTVNQPVAALADLRAAAARNDNRGVYRSRLLLDQDLAARSAAVGRAFRDLGFDELALRQGWTSVQLAPGDYSGHRLLADSYSALPRHEIPRVNELLQSQLLQPQNMTPVQPQLGETNLFILDTAGPSAIGFNEFNPLFSRDGLAFQSSAVAAGNSTAGFDATLGGIAGRLSFSVGGFGFETDGFRPNNDLEQRVGNALVQYAVSPTTSLLAELRATRREQGDLALRFDPASFNPLLRQDEDSESLRVGLRHDFRPGSQVLALVGYQQVDSQGTVGEAFAQDSDLSGYTAEVQHLWSGPRWRLVSGLRHAERSDDQSVLVNLPPPFGGSSEGTVETDSSSAYAYGTLELLAGLAVTAGLAVERFDGAIGSRERLNPKLGVAWQVTDRTTLRATWFRTLQAPFASRQDIQPRLEPTPVVGFNQMFFGAQGETAVRAGLGLDHRIGERTWLGVEASRRDLDVPFLSAPDAGPGLLTLSARNIERSVRSYAYITPSERLAIGLGWDYDKRSNDPQFVPEGFVTSELNRFPIRVAWFHPEGLGASVTGTFVDQRVQLAPTSPLDPGVRDDSDFWSVDGTLSWRLPRRWGLLRLEGRNLSDRRARFQDVDPENPRLAPERLLLLRLTASIR